MYTSRIHKHSDSMSNQAVSKGVGEFRPSQAPKGSGGFLAEFLRFVRAGVSPLVAVRVLQHLLWKNYRVWLSPEAVEVVRVDAEGKYVEVYLNGWRVYIDEDVVEVYGK